MSCEPERVTAFVDQALVEPDVAALRAHVERCATCRSQLAAEQAVHERLRALPSPELPLGLERRLRARIRRRPAFASARLLAAPLALGIVLGSFGAWARGLPPVVAWELSRDHDHCYSKGTPPARVRSEQPQVVGAWFARSGISWLAPRAASLPALPRRLGGGAALFGGRWCYLPDVSAAAHVYYVSPDARLSLFVVGHGVRVSSRTTVGSRGNTVALLRIGPSVIGVVGARAGDVAAAVRELERGGDPIEARLGN